MVGTVRHVVLSFLFCLLDTAAGMHPVHALALPLFACFNAGSPEASWSQ